ncbi:hypothetical protein KM043_001005 [Ampulex compressa]|nr:hypothetical protein KM043_001005 [Ampulex compressa]
MFIGPMSFRELGLNSWIVGQCDSMGLKKPTPIQEGCIPRILAGEDCIGCAKTGSGKTLSFALPILQKLSEDPYGIFALVLTPTRELAFQIADQFAAIGKPIGLKKCVVVGGMDMVAQGLELAKRPHVVVASPGRLADHLQSCDTFSLKRIKFLVLDEADRLLGGRFDEQLSVIFPRLPKRKQVLLFSATMTDALEKAKNVTSGEIFTWDSKDASSTATVKQLDQYYALCPDEAVDSFLVEIVKRFSADRENGSILIFTDTCKNCQLLSMTLNEVGYRNVALHGMNRQKDRLAALGSFKSGLIKILIATDVAARGLDIPAVELVINRDIPNVPKEYVHRVGRTARAGRPGMAISVITPRDIKLLHAIEEAIGNKLKEFRVDDREIVKILTQISMVKREAEMKLDEGDFYERKMINKRKKLILEGKDPDEVADLLERETVKRERGKRRKEKV